MFQAPEPRSRSPPREESFSSTPPRRVRERSRERKRRDSRLPSPLRRDHDMEDSPRRRRYSRSPSPPRKNHARSRSPRRRHDEGNRPKKAGGGGFRWKEKPRLDEDERRDDRGLERGYRDQDKGRPRARARSPTREEKRRDDVEDKFGEYDDRDAKFGGPVPKSSDKAKEQSGEKPKKEKKEKKPAPIAPTGEPMIIVNVNDRLGTKAAIPCLASDPISMFISSPLCYRAR